MSLRIVYFGTPQFSAEILRYLADKDVSIVGIVTQPDRPKGRSLKLQSSPVKEVGEKFFPGVPIFQPEKASNEEVLRQLEALNADLFVVVAFGQILSKKLLAIAPKGCINIHTSLLPKTSRGSADSAGANEWGEAKQVLRFRKWFMNSMQVM